MHLKKSSSKKARAPLLPAGPMPVFGGGGGEVLPHGAGAAGERLHQRGPVLREDGAAAKKESRASGVFEAKWSGTVFWGWWNGKPKDTGGLF